MDTCLDEMAEPYEEADDNAEDVKFDENSQMPDSVRQIVKERIE